MKTKKEIKRKLIKKQKELQHINELISSLTSTNCSEFDTDKGLLVGSISELEWVLK